MGIRMENTLNFEDDEIGILKDIIEDHEASIEMLKGAITIRDIVISQLSDQVEKLQQHSMALQSSIDDMFRYKQKLEERQRY